MLPSIRRITSIIITGTTIIGTTTSGTEAG